MKINLTEGQSQVQCISQPENRPELNNCLVMIEEDCTVCREKFRKVEIGEKIQCQEIVNCKSSSTVEKCDLCEEGFSLSEDHKQCFVESIPFCKELNSNLECVKCKDGMLLSGNQCFAFENENCLEFDGENCTKCDLKSLDNLASQSQVFENILIKMVFSSVSSNSQSEKTLCLKPNSQNPVLSNCKLYNSPLFCRECENGFLPQRNSLANEISQSCVKNPEKTENCILLGPIEECIKCKAGFYLEGDRCFAGDINGCKFYKNQLNCLECQESFTLLTQQNRDLCFYSHKIQNCEKTGFVQLEKNQLDLSCLKCNDLFRKRKISISNQLCFPLRAIPNCKTLDPNRSLCEECDDLYFLNQEFTCVKRKNLTFANCRKFSINSDSCGECEDGFELLSSGDQCSPVEFQTIENCQIQMKGKLECLICLEGFFVNSEKKCASVDIPISNCRNYASSNACAFCDEGFSVRQGICEPILGFEKLDSGVSGKTI